MRYKVYRYSLIAEKGKVIGPDNHFQIFDKSKGPDAYGDYAEYLGRKDSVLMHVRRYRSDFTALIGRHATEREVTNYDQKDDVTLNVPVEDDDYPHAAFICIPRLSTIACADGGKMKADSAMQRLHRIIGHRQNIIFEVQAYKESFDLRKAEKRFKLTEVTFEIFPVNPHTGDLGKQLDQSRKLDHIKKLQGKASAPSSNPLKLNGGLLTAVQELQASGHCNIGFTGLTDDNIEVKVPRQKQRLQLSESSDVSVAGENVDVVVSFPQSRMKYPFPEHHVHQVRRVVKAIIASEEGDDLVDDEE